MNEQFREFYERFSEGKYASATDVEPHLWSSSFWDTMSKKIRDEVFLFFIRAAVQRAMKTMPSLYKKDYEKKGIVPERMETWEDFIQIPGLIKDSSINGVGFREKVRENPFIMKPAGIRETTVYKSGGTRGVPTPTFITHKDREIESHGLKRCFEYMGINSNSVMLSTYNPTHKGGELIKESMLKIGGAYIPRRTTDDAEETIKTIEHYKANVLAAVQGPIVEGDSTKKGGGVDFMSLVEAGQDVLEKNIDILFITGYVLIPEVINWAETHNKILATTLGSSEAIPQATSTSFANGLCKYNNLHVLNGPHFVEVVKEESGMLVPAKLGEEGILCYTTLAREGTLYIRYMPGDSAKLVSGHDTCKCGLKSEIITDIGRLDIQEDVIATGCCIG